MPFYFTAVSHGRSNTVQISYVELSASQDEINVRENLRQVSIMPLK